MAEVTFLIRAIAIEPIITVSWVEPCCFAVPILTFTSLGAKGDKDRLSSGDYDKYQ
jgi:hypothetical protein